MSDDRLQYTPYLTLTKKCLQVDIFLSFCNMRLRDEKWLFVIWYVSTLFVQSWKKHRFNIKKMFCENCFRRDPPYESKVCIKTCHDLQTENVLYKRPKCHPICLYVKLFWINICSEIIFYTPFNLVLDAIHVYVNNTIFFLSEDENYITFLALYECAWTLCFYEQIFIHIFHIYMH